MGSSLVFLRLKVVTLLMDYWRIQYIVQERGNKIANSHTKYDILTLFFTKSEDSQNMIASDPENLTIYGVPNMHLQSSEFEIC
jgi:hypothetical protein